MKALLAALTCLAALAAFAALGCEISPIVTTPSDTPGTRYADCDRAAEDYCEHSLGVDETEMDACVAKHRFQCVSSGGRHTALPRG